MNDVVISRQRILRELQLLLLCLVVSFVLNIYAIIRFKTHWTELITTFPATLALAVVFFVLVALLRGLAFGGRRLLRHKAGH